MTQEALPDLPNGQVRKTAPNYSPEVESASDGGRSSTLIEFPGTNRSLPEWRKQLNQRVREVQERKAREAAEELAAAQEAGLVSCALPSGQLELVPDLENPVTNPIVTKALERLERARKADYSPSYATVTAVAPALTPVTETIEAPVAETKPKLTVVASPQPVIDLVEAATEVAVAIDAAVESPMSMESATVIEMIDEPVVVESIASAPETETPVEEPVRMMPERKPIRVISDNDIALSYLETCLSLPALAGDTRTDIPGLTRRFFASVVDLLLIAVMASPGAAAIYYSGSNWAEPKIIGLMTGITAATMFVYLTICTAMTGRTLAMRLFRMRIIDLRTGMIPTGAQSITRAITYVFSFALGGLGIAYAIIDPDKRAVHDRMSKTIVVRSS